MCNKKVLGGVILVAVLAVGGFLGWKAKEKSAPQNSVVVVDETADWKTYRNFGIEFQYPDSKEWEHRQESVYGTMPQINFDSAGKGPFFVSFGNYADIVKGPQTFEQQVVNLTSNPNGQNTKYIIKDITANGVKGKEIVHTYASTGAGDITVFSALFPLDDQSSIIFTGDSTLLAEVTFNKLISTFKIDEGSKIKKDPISGWLIYKNSDMTFMYPEKFDTDYASFILQITILGQDDDNIDQKGCYEAETGKGGPWDSSLGTNINVGNVNFCFTTGGDVGAGQSYTSYYYTTLKDKKYYVLDYVVHTANACGGYQGSDEKYKECLDFKSNHYDEIVLKPIQNSIKTFKFTK